MKRNLCASTDTKTSRLCKYSTLLFIVGVFLYIYNFQVGMEVSSKKTRPRRRLVRNISMVIPDADQAGAYVVDSAECRIPQFDPWNSMVRPYIRPMRAIRCSPKTPLVASNDSSLFVVEGALKHYRVDDPRDLHCCYRPFYRVVLEDSPSDNDIRYEKECTFFDNEVIIRNSEFVHVKCFLEEDMIYEDYHAFVPKKLKVEKRCRRTELARADAGAVSVLVIGTDSLSRLNMHRQMPQTVARLKALRAIEMLGYNKVGGSTFPNLAAMLTGFSEDELTQGCLLSSHRFVDECRYVWEDFHDVGYRTAFGEDITYLGIFNFRRRGFVKQPTDYYLRPFLSNVEEKIGHNRPINVMFCAGARSMVKVLFDYILKFSMAFKNKLSFGLFWETTIGHDFLNTPRMGDRLYLSFLDALQRQGALDGLALLFVGDHGMRSGDIRKTYQGRLEERQPHFFLLLPPRFRARFASAVANLARNARRLTTHFDLHETLKDLARPSERLSEAALRNRSAQLDLRALNPPRGVSLFLQVPPNRSCKQAGIPASCCICLVNLTSDVGRNYVQRVAKNLLKHINRLLQPFPQCSYLVLGAVRGAQMQAPQPALRAETVDKGVLDTVVVIRTRPGGAEFEGTVRRRPASPTLRVVGAVSRLNLNSLHAGTSTPPHCVNASTPVRDLCHCRQ